MAKPRFGKLKRKRLRIETADFIANIIVLEKQANTISEFESLAKEAQNKIRKVLYEHAAREGTSRFGKVSLAKAARSINRRRRTVEEAVYDLTRVLNDIPNRQLPINTIAMLELKINMEGDYAEEDLQRLINFIDDHSEDGVIKGTRLEEFFIRYLESGRIEFMTVDEILSGAAEYLGYNYND